MKTRIISVFSVLLAVLSIQASAQISMAFSTIGNTGNANDTTGYGGVSYNYAIGTYDVTVSQYATFLNAVAATDTYSLYNTSMASDSQSASITRSGASGSYSYSVIAGTANNPITHVSWFDAARFTNWLGNGQLTGAQNGTTTEAGAYTLNGSMSGVSISMNVGAVYHIPTENEWYKAAYYDPTLNSGAGGYYLYTTQSNTAPGASWASRTLTNQANTFSGVSLTGSSNWLTPVGSFTNSASAYGTFDQGGDVSQWTDSVYLDLYRALRGGSWSSSTLLLKSSFPEVFNDPANGHDLDIGFRVATVPEPTVLVSLMMGLGMLGCMQRSPF